MAASVSRQLSFPGMCSVEDALNQLATASIQDRGAVFTRSEVVDFILDLVGYTTDQSLHQKRLLEPSVGYGDFLLVAIERLITAWRTHAPDAPAATLADCIRAVELHRASFEVTREKVTALLQRHGIALDEARELVRIWLMQGDFLLTSLSGSFDFVVGNPPYVRQELIPDALIAEYRIRYRTVFDRADIYVPFIERSLGALSQGGALGFICADRWMKNRYGGPLREMVANGFHLKIYIDMCDTPAFHSDVIAYPAITIIVREKPGSTRVARRPAIEKTALNDLAQRLIAGQVPEPYDEVKEMEGIAVGAEPWILDSSDQFALVRRLERDFLDIEHAGCKVGIGVATGADDVFIGPFNELDVEEDSKLPLVMTRDILTGTVKWRGFGIVNPFADGGGLVDLRSYPRMQRYFAARKEQIVKRHIAQKSPVNWYRTIDRIDSKLTWRPKLLIPDIKGNAHIVYEEGRFYPHHNLYFITSDEWDLRALQAVLRSGIARLFVSAYSTRMRGGALRFQAQYLRRIRLPRWGDVSAQLRDDLKNASEKGDTAACHHMVFQLYGLSAAERTVLVGNGG
ncbi:MAG: Eco57I restriction-modification methylase domain-containing protein [Magnetococcales bacterium]|nr:Eco57I restriction-modification methylase domain-containing protein [Magnetococcales bacterium]MBF0148566.1 Eco57I restriction-modification methylase domain-containing protein [Magnetococcales bacterium]MBF0173791.1 Eco57I restriction-modification methylase domain-containing protein [Magnetococcales bacterium]MBF0629741.1 Eco57I restriction-modification methylase domain-containing protein [Magnetococcales bacterium]